MMEMKNNLTIDFGNKKIILSAKLAKLAFTVGTDEFDYISKLVAAYPTFELAKKEIDSNESKKTYEGLSIHKMRAFIIHKKDEAATKEFDAIINIYKDEKGMYAAIKRNFLNRYKDEYNNLCENDKLAIDNLAIQLKKEAAAKAKKEAAEAKSDDTDKNLINISKVGA